MQTIQAGTLKFPVVGENGAVTECEALLALEHPTSRKRYLVYTDNSTDAQGSLILFASAYRKPSASEHDGKGMAHIELLPIESNEEWQFVEATLNRASGN